MAASFTIVGVGEALFDVFPDKQVLGGAPLNVAVHAHQLGSRRQGRGVVVSRVGQDEPGTLILEELARRGMATDYVQTDPDHGTGRVYVEMHPDGGHSFDIVRDVAWDWLQFDPDIESLASRCQAVCFGSLAQRHPQSRSTIYRFLASATRAIRLFDVNLRQNYYDQHTIRKSLELSTVLKLNDEELPTLIGLLALGVGRDDFDAAARLLLKQYKLQMIALTRGERGTVLYTPTARLEQEPVHYDRAEHSDTVGAGDACTAGLLVGMVSRLPLEKTLALANHMGAYVASQPGATPELPQSVLDLMP